MIDNERYLSVAVRTTLGQSISNQYIDCAGMQSVWTDFGDWEVEPDTFILQDVIGCGYFGIVWKGKQQFKDDAVALLAGQPYLRYTGRGFESCGWAPLRIVVLGKLLTCVLLSPSSLIWYGIGQRRDLFGWEPRAWWKVTLPTTGFLTNVICS